MKTICGDVHFCMKPFSWSPISLCPWNRGVQVPWGAAAQYQGGLQGAAPTTTQEKKQPTSILKPVCYPRAPEDCLFISFRFNTLCERLGAGILCSCGASSEIVLFDLPAKLGGWVETEFSPLFLFSKNPSGPG